MKLTHEQCRARLTDYLYGELGEDEQREVEACLAESESLRRELSALEETLGVVREALRGPLAEAPPSRVRSAVLAAALAATEERARLPPARPIRSRSASLQRSAWLFPALGAAAALALVIFGRSAEREQVVLELPLREAPAGESPASSRKGESERRTAEAPRVAGEPAPVPNEGTGAQLPRGARAAEGRARGEPAVGSAPYARAAPAARVREQVGNGTPKRAGKGPTQGGAGAMADDARRASADTPASTSTGTSARSALPREGSARSRAENSAEADEEAARGPAAPQRFAVPPAAEGFAAPPSGGSAARAPRAPAEAAGDASDGRLPLVELTRRAREHLDAGRYRSAEASYRELLRRFPDDRHAPDWQRELGRVREALRADSEP